MENGIPKNHIPPRNDDNDRPTRLSMGVREGYGWSTCEVLVGYTETRGPRPLE